MAIGFINMWANLSGMIGSPIMGWMKDHEWRIRIALLFPAACYVVGALIIAMLRVPKFKVAGSVVPVETEAAVKV